jgi:membrane protease YdiL (CAAX protease family)
MEERPLLQQLLDAEDVPRPSLGERRGFGDVPWGHLDLLVVSFVGLIAQIIVMPMGYIGTAHFATPGSDVGVLSFFVAVVASYGLLMLAVWLFAIRRHKGSAASLGFRPVDVRGLLGLLAAFAVTVVVANLIFGSIAPTPRAQEVFRYGDGVLAVALMALLVLIAAPLTEEVFFRGFLLQGLARRLPFWPAAVITSAIFALAHVWWQLYLPIFVLGLVFSWLFWRTGSLWAPIAAHATINATSLFVALILM